MFCRCSRSESSSACIERYIRRRILFAANIIAAQVHLKPDCVLGLATGSSPVGTYKELIAKYESGELDFSQVKTVNLDEYVGLPYSHPASFRKYLMERFVEKLPVKMKEVNLVEGDAADLKGFIANLGKKIAEIMGVVAESAEPMVAYVHCQGDCEKAKKDYGITGRKMRQIRELDRYMMENFHITFGNRIMKQLKEYVSAYGSCGGSEEEAIDDMVAKKIMRKLETQNPVYVRNSIDGLLATIEEVFGQDKMEITKEYLRHLERTM